MSKRGEKFSNLLGRFENGSKFKPTWKLTKGEGLATVSPDGKVTAKYPGDATIEGRIPGLTAKSGF